MASFITEVHSISAAAGWYVKGTETALGYAGTAVVCFALVSAMDRDPGGLIEKLVIPLTADDLGLGSLIGHEIDEARELAFARFWDERSRDETIAAFITHQVAR
jgi:hypothetical protein